MDLLVVFLLAYGSGEEKPVGGGAGEDGYGDRRQRKAGYSARVHRG